MIGLQIVNDSIMAGYGLLLLFVIGSFALYDILHKRVPNKALAVLLPVFLAAPVLEAWKAHPAGGFWATFGTAFVYSLLGAGSGFLILLCAALISKGNAGVGGGDIKLATAMGFAYGPYGILGILLIASVLCFPAAMLCRSRVKGTALSLPFVPFLAAGSLVITTLQKFF